MDNQPKPSTPMPQQPTHTERPVVADSKATEGIPTSSVAEESKKVSQKKSFGSVFTKFAGAKKTPVQKETTEAHIKTYTELLLKVFGISLAIVIISTCLLLYLTSSKVKQLKVSQKQFLTTQNQTLDLNSAISFLESQKQDVEVIRHTLPDENGLVEFIEIMEAILSQHATAPSIKFSALAPTGTGPDKYLPFTITMATDTENFSQFLRKIEKLPYLVEVTTISTEATGQAWTISIAARVFVKDPFKPQANNQLKIAI